MHGCFCDRLILVRTFPTMIPGSIPTTCNGSGSGRRMELVGVVAKPVIIRTKRTLTVTRFELARETHHGFGAGPKRDAVTTWLHCRDKWPPTGA